MRPRQTPNRAPFHTLKLKYIGMHVRIEGIAISLLIFWPVEVLEVVHDEEVGQLSGPIFLLNLLPSLPFFFDLVP